MNKTDVDPRKELTKHLTEQLRTNQGTQVLQQLGEVSARVLLAWSETCKETVKYEHNGSKHKEFENIGPSERSSGS